jgi:hypothetical protein
MIDTTSLAAAAAAAHTATLSSHLLGELGAGGAAAVSTALLVAGVKGKKKIKFTSQQSIATWGLITGVFYGAAGSIWTTPTTITGALTQSVAQGPWGHMGPAAFACLLAVLIYGFELKRGVAAVLGVSAASILAASGGLWAIGSTTISATLLNLVG